MKRTMFGIGFLAILGAAFTGCGNERPHTRESTANEQATQTLVVPASTSVMATLDRRISTGTSRNGDSMDLTTTEAIARDGRTVVPAGAAIRGTLRNVEASGSASGPARMTLTFDTLTGLDDRVHVLNAVPLVLQAGSGTDTDSRRISGGEAIGAEVGSTVAGGKGAALGTGSGAGAGVIVMRVTPGEELVLEPGQKISVTLTAPMSVEVAARN